MATATGAVVRGAAIATNPLISTGYQDIFIPSNNMMTDSAGAPGKGSLAASAIDTRYFDSAPAGSESLMSALRLPNNYKAGTDIFWYAHWCANSTATSTGVRWRLSHVSGDIGDTLPGTIVNSAVTGNPTSTAWEHICTGTNLSETGFSPGCVINFRIQRQTGHADDDMGAFAFLLGLSFQFQTQRLNTVAVVDS